MACVLIIMLVLINSTGWFGVEIEFEIENSHKVNKNSKQRIKLLVGPSQMI